MKCENCKWWGGERAHDDDVPYGRCRATLPAPYGDIELPISDMESPHFPRIYKPKGEWPWVAFDDWCSGFAQKRELEPSMPREP